MQRTIGEAEREPLIDLIQTSCQKTRELDINEHFKQEVDELLKRLQETSARNWVTRF